MSNYSTNLTEKQWQVIKKIVEPQERSRKHFIDYEFLTETAETMVTIAFIQIALKRFF